MSVFFFSYFRCDVRMDNVSPCDHENAYTSSEQHCAWTKKKVKNQLGNGSKSTKSLVKNVSFTCCPGSVWKKRRPESRFRKTNDGRRALNGADNISTERKKKQKKRNEKKKRKKTHQKSVSTILDFYRTFIFGSRSIPLAIRTCNIIINAQERERAAAAATGE